MQDRMMDEINDESATEYLRKKAAEERASKIKFDEAYDRVTKRLTLWFLICMILAVAGTFLGFWAVIELVQWVTSK